MLALIDGDIIKYSVGFACQKTVYTDDDGTRLLVEQVKGTGMRSKNLDTGQTTVYPAFRTKKAVLEEIGGDWQEEVVPEPERYVGFTVKQMINSILKNTGASEYAVYLSRGDCFRVGVYPEYKANRKDIPKPYHVHTIEDYLLRHHPTMVFEEIEADDAMGIDQFQSFKQGNENTIICSLDKDLQMIPGWHYNWNATSVFPVSEGEAMFNFWCQTLTGDATDNIPGLTGVGKKTAEKMLEPLDPPEYKDFILAEYANQDMTEADFERNAMLLWILRKPLFDTYGKTYEEFFK